MSLHGSDKVSKGEGGLPSLEEVGVYQVLSVGKRLGVPGGRKEREREGEGVNVVKYELSD